MVFRRMESGVLVNWSLSIRRSTNCLMAPSPISRLPFACAWPSTKQTNALNVTVFQLRISHLSGDFSWASREMADDVANIEDHID